MLSLLASIMKKALRSLRDDKSAAQLVEEGLLLSIALFMLAVIIGTVHNLNQSFSSFFDTVWEGLSGLAEELFGWLWGA